MGPIRFPENVWPPVEPADRSPRGDLAREEHKDRTTRRPPHRRRHRGEDSPPDADQFTHALEEEEADTPSP